MPATLPTDHPCHITQVQSDLAAWREQWEPQFHQRIDAALTFTTAEWDRIAATLERRGLTTTQIPQYLRQLIIDDAGL